LAVRQVAGVLTGDRSADLAHARIQLDRSQELVHVLHFRGELPGAGGVSGVALEQLVVFLESRAAAGRVGDDRVEACVARRIDVAGWEAASVVAQPGVDVERSAAGLTFGNRYLAAVGLKHSDGGLVEARKTEVGDAAGEERYAIFALTLGGEDASNLAEEK